MNFNNKEKPMVKKERLVNSFCRLAKIKSPSGQEEDMAVEVVKELTRLGLKVTRDSYGNVVAKMDGVGQPVILCGHLDTVPVGQDKEIVPIVENGIVRSDGKTILGADNKDFIAAIIEAISVISEDSLPHQPLEIVLTREEEQIARGAVNLDTSLLEGKECLIADNAAPLGEITLSAPYTDKFEVTVRGKEAHVKNPEAGIDAIRAAASLISRMPLGRVNDVTTANVSFISGGLAGIIEKTEFAELSKQPSNSVPNIVKFFGEVRGLEKDLVKETFSEINKLCRLVEKETGVTVDFVMKKLNDGYMHEEKDPFLKKIASIFLQQGRQPRFEPTIGGSDANVLNKYGIKSVVISSGEKNNHTCNEQIAVEDLVELTDFLIRFVTTL